MRAAHMNGHDGFLRPHRTRAMGHGNRHDTKVLDGLFRQTFEHRCESVLPGVKLQAEHVSLAFGFSRQANETDDGPTPFGVQPAT